MKKVHHEEREKTREFFRMLNERAEEAEDKPESLVPLEIDEMASRLDKELEGVKVEEIAESVRKGINAKIAKEHPELLTE